MTKFEILKQRLEEAFVKDDDRERKSKAAIWQILIKFAEYLEVPVAQRIYAKPSEGLTPRDGSSPDNAPERLDRNTWAGTLVIEIRDDATISQLGITIFVDFQESGAEFWTRGDERRFPVSHDGPSATEPFFDHVYTGLLKELSEEGRQVKNPIGFTSRLSRRP
jgi:hypothetical protein